MATQEQAAVSGVLSQLGLEMEDNSMPGSEVTLRVTQETVKKIKDLANSSAFVTVGSDGIPMLAMS